MLNKKEIDSEANTYQNKEGENRIEHLKKKLKTTMESNKKDLDPNDASDKNFQDQCDEFVKQLSSIDKEKTDLVTLKNKLISELNQLN